ncbi:thiamine transporter 2 [Synchiropus splendidus]|uniref:thiamine transporter 2 n=1 Tax=Synchiropus splendidus TaxID=270530 RepID=UPI00237EB753|nr:thiamine transporter 2 [Synchiropus splendidus]
METRVNRAVSSASCSLTWLLIDNQKGLYKSPQGERTWTQHAIMQRGTKWRSDWKYPTFLLCTYGFFTSVKPIEPFLLPYMTGPDKNLTTEQATNEIYPVWTYSYLSVLVPVFLLTDWLRYKPVVVFQGVTVFITTALLRWTTTVPAMQVVQFFYGVVTASEVAYFSYIYSMIDVKNYRKATSYCRGVQLLAYTVGSVLGQLLISFTLMSYNNILVFTMVLIGIGLFASLFLPMPEQSMFFHPKKEQQEEEEKEDVSENSKDKLSCGRVLLMLWRDFLQCYSSRRLLYWSVWWAMATCGYNQTVNYIQVLWEHQQPSQNLSIYNGGVEAVSSLLSAATAYGIGFTQVRWELWGELALGGFSGLAAVVLFLMTFIGNIWVCYTGYAVFKCLYMLLITIAMYQIATDLTMDRYALVFGANTFGALVLQTILTSVVVDQRGLGLDIISQFTIYSSYFAIIAVVFSLSGVLTLWKARRHNREDIPPDKNQSPIQEHRL